MAFLAFFFFLIFEFTNVLYEKKKGKKRQISSQKEVIATGDVNGNNLMWPNIADAEWSKI